MKNIFRNPFYYITKYTEIVLIILFWSFLVLPTWWFTDSIEIFKEAHPNFGILLYYLVKSFYWVLVFCSLSALLVRIISKICTTDFYHTWSRIKVDMKNLLRYFTGDVYQSRIFVSKIFFKGLALVYFIGIASLLWQIELVTKNGLIPYEEFTRLTIKHEGASAYFNYPSIFWISQSNWFIYFVLISGVVIALIAIVDKIRHIYFFILWFIYLSIVTFGRDMFQFPWDTFLLEIGFISIFASYFIKKYQQLPRIILLAFFLLFFRQWFSMAATKIFYGDSTWYDLTFMKYFWLNQPSPTPLAIYAYLLPMWTQKIITSLTLILEASIPLAMFFGRKGRIIAFIISLFLSICIQLVGNFGFFNIITAILGLWCIDDYFFGNKLHERVSKVRLKPIKLFALIPIVLVICFNFFYVALFAFDNKTQKHIVNSANYFFHDDTRTNLNISKTSVIFNLGEVFTNWRIVSPHGVFKNIPKKRWKLLTKIKTGKEWKTVCFSRGKDVSDFSFSSPYMPRLQYQFFYQSFGVEFNNVLQINRNRKHIPSFMENFIYKILNNTLELNSIIEINSYVEQMIFVHFQLITNDLNNLEFKVIDTIMIDKFQDYKPPIIDWHKLQLNERK